MAVCQRCGKGEAEWRCQVCGRVVCKNCARLTPEGVFCADHEPKVKERKEIRNGGSKALKQLFFMLLFLTAGLALIVFIGDWLIGTILGNVPGTFEFAETLKRSGWIIVYGMAGLTFLLGFGWLASRRRRK